MANCILISRRTSFNLSLLLACAAWLPASDADTFLLRNVDVYPVVGPRLAAASMLVQDGKIAGIGPKIAAPKGVRIIDGQGLRAYPGLIDSGTELGLSEIADLRMTVDSGELGAFMPQLRALTAVNPDSEHLPVVRVNGITSVVTFPSPENGDRKGGERQIVAGQAALIHAAGWTWEEMAVNGSAALLLIFPSLPVNQTGFAEAKRTYDREIQQIDEFFDQARRYERAKTAGDSNFKIDLKLEAMLPVLDGRLKQRVMREGLKIYLRESDSVWRMNADGEYEKPRSRSGAVRSAQGELLHLLAQEE